MKVSIRSICFIGMFAAIISVLSIFKIPTPWGVPFTLQTFAVALCGYVLGKWHGGAATVLYILIGLIGVPVFSGLTAGPGVLAGPTGGYIYGFILMAFFCGLARELAKKHILITVALSVLALACCHVPGIIQLKIYYRMTWAGAAMAGTVPYLLKDALSMAAAYLVAIAVRKALLAAGILDWEKGAQKAVKASPR